MSLMIRRPSYSVPTFEDLVRSQWLGEDFENRMPGLNADVYETPEAITVETAVPGLKPEEINIQIVDGLLTISGETKREEKEDKREYHLREMRYGRFSQTLSLPTSVESNKAEASFNNGMLKIILPKAEEAKPRQIQIKAVEEK